MLHIIMFAREQFFHRWVRK